MARKYTSTLEEHLIPFIELKGMSGYGYVQVSHKDKSMSGKIFVRYGTVIAAEASLYRTSVLQRILDMPEVNERSANLLTSRFGHDPENILIAEAVLDQQMAPAAEMRKLIKENFIDCLYEMWTWDKIQLDWVANKEPTASPTVPAIKPGPLLDMIRAADQKISHEIPELLQIEPGELLQCRLQSGAAQDASQLRHLDKVLLSRADTGSTLDEIIYQTGQSRSVAQLAVAGLWLNGAVTLLTPAGKTLHVQPATPEPAAATPEPAPAAAPAVQAAPTPVEVPESPQLVTSPTAPTQTSTPAPSFTAMSAEERRVTPFAARSREDFSSLDDDSDYDSSLVAPFVNNTTSEEPEPVEEEPVGETSIFDVLDDDSSDESLSIFDTPEEDVTENASEDFSQLDDESSVSASESDTPPVRRYADEAPVLKPDINYFAEAFDANFNNLDVEEKPDSSEPESEEASNDMSAYDDDDDDMSDSSASIFDSEEEGDADGNEMSQPELTIEASETLVLAATEATAGESSTLEDPEPEGEPETEEAPSNQEEEAEQSTLEPEAEESNSSTLEPTQHDTENENITLNSSAPNTPAKTRMKDRLISQFTILLVESEEALAEADKELSEQQVATSKVAAELAEATESRKLAEQALGAAVAAEAAATQKVTEQAAREAEAQQNQSEAKEDYLTVKQQLEEYQQGA